MFCSRQCRAVDGKTLLLIQPLDWETDAPAGEPLVAGDTVGAGAGETVFFVAAREAIVAFENWEGETAVGTPLPPVDAAIVGIIDGKQIVNRAEALKR